ncbi:MAG: TraR/DksA C4-type zinc finger protein [Puniceicoccales bacterium]|jgi:RNA polymerase-binding transcription factor DksA|nr:TraR/DksA C4-type zinc finger protein [Puniceicoccales bacterium]
MSKVENEKSNTHALLKALKNRKKQIDISSNVDVPYFSMEDVRRVLRERENEQRENENRVKIQNKQKLIEKVLVENKNVVVSPAGIADILGFNPIAKTASPESEENSVEKNIEDQYKKYYAKLLQLKALLDHKLSVVPTEIEFAWSMLKNEVDAEKEVQDAIQRILNKTYGICEITGEKIAEERLDAVPFTRYSVTGQREYEWQATLKKEKQAHLLFADKTEDVFNTSYDEQEEE